MKKTLLIMVMALAVLLTQCRKPSITFPTPSVTTTVSMTITAGPGSKTDITTEGGIVWSENDKIYVGDGSKYVGCLAIQSGVGNATGTFTGDVTAGTGDDCTFHFYYLGNAKDYSTDLASHNTSVEVDFSSQDIHADGMGNLTNASKHHVGYGKAEHVKVEADKPVTGLQVSMKSKVAIAYFCFQKGEGESATPYEGALTLSGEHIYNKMTVNFNGSDFSFTPVKDGDIRLTNTTTHLKYVMLVPPADVAEEKLNFGGGDMTGSTKLENGIEANKFYRVDGSMPIVVKMTPIEFSVSSGTKVKFSPGNLYWDGSAFHFEANQWSFADSWNTNYVSHFFWSNTTDWQESAKEPYAASYSYGTRTTNDNFFTNATPMTANPGFHVNGETGENQWRTLSRAEWSYLIGGSSPGRATSLRKRSAVTFGESGPTVSGLIIMPDGWEGTLNETTDYTTWQSLESFGAVFLPAAGLRSNTSISLVGSNGRYWLSTPYEEKDGRAYEISFTSGAGNTVDAGRNGARAVRLVRSAS